MKKKRKASVKKVIKKRKSLKDFEKERAEFINKIQFLIVKRA